jgi:hypothetical protein
MLGLRAISENGGYIICDFMHSCMENLGYLEFSSVKQNWNAHLFESVHIYLEPGVDLLVPETFREQREMTSLFERRNLFCDSNMKSTPSIRLNRLACLGILHQQIFTRRNVGSTLLSFALPLLMLQSVLIIHRGSVN